MKIILFRHGEKHRPDLANCSDVNDVCLTDLGNIQINKLAKTLKENFPFLISSDVIYSSPYTRAIQSAKIVQSVLNIKENIIVPEFGEFMAYTNYQNPYEIRQHIQEMAMQNPDWISPETNFSLNNILSNFKTKIISIFNEKHPDFLLIASHGGIIRNFVYSLESKFRPNDELIAESKIHEGGYTLINYDGKNFSVDQFDVHDHLV